MQVALTVSVRREAGALFLGNGVATGNPGHEQNTREPGADHTFVQLQPLSLSQ
jgi:hypothetical protein